MGEIFRVAIHYDNDCGYIEYDPDKREIRVVLGNQDKRQAVEEFLAKPHMVWVPKHTLQDFEEVRLVAADNLESLKILLTHLWEHTKVLVDWSREVHTEGC
ncbi:MAG: hypothetical protein H6Q73_3676 [Firmicutes bacterium]|nr:hypothetical protein [Bacillota bacterium]